MSSTAGPRRSRSRSLTAIAVTLLLAAPAAVASAQPSPPDTSVKVEPEGFIPEPRFIARGLRFATRTLGDGGQQNDGFYPEFSNMVTGAGWISAGPGYRHWLSGDRAIVDASTAISWRMYKMAQARFELTKLARSRLSVGSQLRWQDLTQVTYFGPGAGSLEDDRSEYRMKSTDVVGYATLRPTEWLSIGGRVGWLKRPTLMSPGGAFKRGHPDTQTVFPDDPVFALEVQPNYVHGDAMLTVDTRDSRSHPARGGVYRATMTHYSDRSAGMFSFRRYEAEAAQFVPLASPRVVLAVHGWMVASDVGAGHVVPFYLMPALGGHNTLRGDIDFRFHDNDLLVLNAESRIALFTHIDFAAFVDVGNVAARMSDLNLDRRSYGVGLRLHSNTATLGRFDVAHGPEGWRFLFRTADPLHFSRFSRRTAAAPFVP